MWPTDIERVRYFNRNGHAAYLEWLCEKTGMPFKAEMMRVRTRPEIDDLFGPRVGPNRRPIEEVEDILLVVLDPIACVTGNLGEDEVFEIPNPQAFPWGSVEPEGHPAVKHHQRSDPSHRRPSGEQDRPQGRGQDRTDRFETLLGCKLRVIRQRI